MHKCVYHSYIKLQRIPECRQRDTRINVDTSCIKHGSKATGSSFGDHYCEGACVIVLGLLSLSYKKTTQNTTLIKS